MSGHMGVMNTKALETAGIDQNTLDPDGGLIGREKDSFPSGYLEETAFTSLTDIIPEADISEMAQLMTKAQDIYISYGITTAQEGLMKYKEFDILKNSDLKIDVVGYADIKSCGKLPSENHRYVQKYNNRLKIGGYKVFLDGSPQGLSLLHILLRSFI